MEVEDGLQTVLSISLASFPMFIYVFIFWNADAMSGALAAILNFQRELEVGNFMLTM